MKWSQNNRFLIFFQSKTINWSILKQKSVESWLHPCWPSTSWGVLHPYWPPNQLGVYSTTLVQYLYISCYLSDNKPVLSYLLSRLLPQWWPRRDWSSTELCPQLSLGPCADNVTVPLDLTQLSCPGFTLAAGLPSGFTTDGVGCWGGALWRACNLQRTYSDGKYAFR
jgi:hypothetical protein